MSEQEDNELQARVIELEARVAALESRLDVEEPAPIPAADVAPEAASPPIEEHSADPEPAASSPSLVHLVDKIGIALLLLGVGFLLKYSYDQGWLTETFRVGLGGLTGAVLLAAGFHQREDNRALSGVLNGGAIATFYGTIYAAFELYDLVPAAFALAGTIGVTMLSFALAVRQEQPALASIATVGGFATPFLMEGGPEPIPLSVFAMVVLAGASAIYLLKGWRSLLATATVGGFSVIGFAVDSAGGGTESIVTLVALTFATAFAAALPAIRSRYFDGEFRGPETFFAVAAPFVAFPLAHIVFEDEAVYTAIAVGVVGAAFYALSLVARARRTFQLIAILLGVCFPAVVLGVEPVGIAAAAAAVAYSWLGVRSSYVLYLPAILCMLPVAGVSLFLLQDSTGDLFGTSKSAFLVFAVATFVAIGAGLRNRMMRWFFWYSSALFGMAVVASQLGSTAVGLVTGLWGSFALAALVAGFLRDNGPLQGLGILTVLLTSGKLLFFDLESVDTLVRVGLFMAMGAAMLFLSYLIPRWQQTNAPPETL